MSRNYDAIVVGARCAGAPLAMLLAERGQRVLVVDKATFPSDTLSTLVIQPTGVAALERWGLLGEVVATGCPPIERFTFDFGPVVIAGRPRAATNGAGVRAADASTSGTAYAPRRTVLDTILVEAASRAGAEVRQGFSVDEVLIDDGVVTGIRGTDESGRIITERARVVVGADGWNSVVARAVGAERYHDKPVLENAFYTFWSGLPVDGMVTLIRGDRGIAAIPTNDDLTLLLVGCPFADAAEFRRDVEGSYQAAVDRDPAFAERLAAATREDRFSSGGVPNFFRMPHGPGWALVGDAGYTKDPITAQGISDALCGAEALATALERTWAGDADALRVHQERRDEAALPLYDFTTQLATLEPPPPEMQELLGVIAGSQPAMDDFVSVSCGTLSPAQFFDPANLATLAG